MVSRRAVIITVGTLVAIGVGVGVGIKFGILDHQQQISMSYSSSSTSNASSGTSSGTSSGRSQGIVGDMTYYSTGLGACGQTSTDDDDICAISHIVYDAAANGPNPNTNPLCGRTIQAHCYDEQVGQQRSVVLTVVDRCTDTGLLIVHVSWNARSTDME
ncbi:MAG: hypothetical protein Q9222_003058 [Ikaeria aurantiellina]